MVAVIEIVSVAVAFALPAASVTPPDATVTTAGPDDDRVGVNVAV